MANLQIKLNNKEYPVQCDDTQIEIIQLASDKLSSRFEKLKKLSPSASNEYIIFLCALSLESEMITKSTNFDSIDDNVDFKNLENSLSEILEITESLKSKIE